jgi:hypothetical protein
MVVVLYSIPLIFSLKSAAVLDNDLWWHLRTGQWVLAHHAVPATDPFSAPGMGKPWVAYSWLFEIALYGIYRGFGLTGIVLLVGILSLAIAAALHRLITRFAIPFALSFLLCAVGLLALAPMLTSRPWLITILFFILEIDILIRWYRGNRRTLLYLPLLFIVWANVHIQFIYGLFLLGAAAFCNLLLAYRSHPAEAAPPARDVRTASIAALACFAATLLNPYGPKLYYVVWQYASQWVPFELVQELQATTFRSLPGWLVLFSVLASAFMLGLRRERWPLPYFLLAAGAVISFRATRDLWFVLVVAVTIIAWELSKSCEWSGQSQLAKSGFARRAVLPAMICILLVGFSVVRARHLTDPRLRQDVIQKFPVAAVEFVASHHYPGPLFNDFDWGGYLIWSLPDLPVSMDGRTNVYGNELLQRHYRTWMGASDWASDPNLKSAQVVIANVDLPLTALLTSDRRFELVYKDPIAAVFVRSGH